MTFTSLVLALAVLAPASALGKAQGTDRPVKAAFSYISVLELRRLTFDYEGPLLVSHLGTTTAQGSGSIVLTGFNAFEQRDSWVITAANGDQVFGTNAETGTGGPGGLLAGSDETLVQTITGGTGRFRDATGTLRGRFHNVLISLVRGVATYSVQGSSEGTISY